MHSRFDSTNFCSAFFLAFDQQRCFYDLGDSLYPVRLVAYRTVILQRARQSSLLLQSQHAVLDVIP